MGRWNGTLRTVQKLGNSNSPFLFFIVSLPSTMYALHPSVYNNPLFFVVSKGYLRSAQVKVWKHCIHDNTKSTSMEELYTCWYVDPT